MTTDPRETILGLISNDDISLFTGEQEYYTENDNYSLTIVYSLEKSDSFSISGKYDFDVLSIFLVDNETGEEEQIVPDEQIKKELLYNSEINDWSDMSDDKMDLYIDDNY